MSRIFETCAGLTFLVAAPLAFAQIPSRLMQDRPRARQSEPMDLAPVAKQQETSAIASALPKNEAPLLRFVCNTGYTLGKCHQDVAVLRTTLAKYPIAQLGNWTWILVRSEDWKAILVPRGLDPDSPAFTYFAKRETFIEEALVANVPGRADELIARWHLSPGLLRDLAVAHELGHAWCGDKDEAKANQVAQSLREGKSLSCKVNSGRAGGAR